MAEYERVMRRSALPVPASAAPASRPVAPATGTPGTTVAPGALPGDEFVPANGSDAEPSDVASNKEDAAGAHGHAPLHGADRDETAETEADSDADYPGFSPEQWEARQPVRQLLYSLLRRQTRGYEAERRELLQQSIQGPTDLERAAEVAEVTPDSLAARKRDELEFRQLSNLLSMLLKLDRPNRPEKAAA